MNKPTLNSIYKICNRYGADALALDGLPPLFAFGSGLRMGESLPVNLNSIRPAVGDRLVDGVSFRGEAVEDPPRAVFFTRCPKRRDTTAPEPAIEQYVLPTPPIYNLLSSCEHSRDCTGLVLIEGMSPIFWTRSGLFRFKSAKLAEREIVELAQLNRNLPSFWVSPDYPWHRGSFETENKQLFHIDVFRERVLCILFYKIGKRTID